ncbi:MAG: glucosamine-6-phosphate deaminase [Opitutaceae bacterium]|jgi:glucosamine-6-phosphate deaminase|nr:glucosamine-6-phosphate deaminase [Opitutaceae bacterium]
MHINKLETRELAGAAAARLGAEHIRQVIARRGEATIIVATGASQFEVLAALVKEPDVRWECVTFFHLDEYVGLPVSHPASFRRYLWERFHKRLPAPPRRFCYVDGEAAGKDARAECARIGNLIRSHPVDVCFAGIGENAHLAFNDPPADFDTEEPYLVVTLDEPCRAQQVGEGWFKTVDEVPRQAISMSVRQILKSDLVIITAPDERKARAIRDSVEGPVTNATPSSILQTHANTHLFLDRASARLLAS